MAPARLRGGSPTLTIEAAPAYEFVVAIASIFEERDTMEVGPYWFAEIGRASCRERVYSNV